MSRCAIACAASAASMLAAAAGCIAAGYDFRGYSVVAQDGGAGGGGGSAGAAGGGGASCGPLVAKPAACNDCLHAKCCDRLRACGQSTACVDFIACFQACPKPITQACVDACAGKYPEGYQTYRLLDDCGFASCSAPCTT